MEWGLLLMNHYLALGVFVIGGLSLVSIGISLYYILWHTYTDPNPVKYIDVNFKRSHIC